MDFKDSLQVIFGGLWEDRERIRAKEKNVRCTRICLTVGNSSEILLVISPEIFYDSNSLLVLTVGACEIGYDKPFSLASDLSLVDRWIKLSSKEELNFWKEKYLPLCYSLADRDVPPSSTSSWVRFPTGIREEHLSFYRPALFVPLFSSLGGISKLFKDIKKEDPQRVERDFAGFSMENLLQDPQVAAMMQGMGEKRFRETMEQFMK